LQEHLLFQFSKKLKHQQHQEPKLSMPTRTPIRILIPTTTTTQATPKWT